MSDSPNLEERVGQLVYDVRLMERALHDRGSWSMRWRGFEAPAERVVSDGSVTFYASFPVLEDDGDQRVLLLLDGAELRSRQVEVSGRTALDLDWSLAVDVDRTVLTSA